MRFKKGDRVEVFSKEEVATGAWLCAEIVSAHGDKYRVKYGLFPRIIDSEIVMDWVPKDAVRPCPPPVEEEGDYVKGNLIEVLDDFSWKMARVEKVVDKNTYLVRLFGLCEGFRVHKSHLRARQCWQDGKWFLLGKGLKNFNKPIGVSVSDTRTTQWSPVDDADEILKTCVGSNRILKRKSPPGNLEENYPVASGKKRLIETVGGHILSVNPSPTSEKVDEFVYANESLGDNYVHASFNVGAAEFSRMNTRESGSCLVGVSTSEDSDSCSSSVGSCTVVSGGACSSPFGVSTHSSNDLEDCYSDAESSCGPKYEEKRCSSDGKIGFELNRSELCTYFSEVRALYALGPLRWEDEERLTNLRHLLHISTDEHLMANISSAMLEACMPCF